MAWTLVGDRIVKRTVKVQHEQGYEDNMLQGWLAFGQITLLKHDRKLWKKFEMHVDKTQNKCGSNHRC